jgi:hypothetical protein
VSIAPFLVRELLFATLTNSQREDIIGGVGDITDIADIAGIAEKTNALPYVGLAAGCINTGLKTYDFLNSPSWDTFDAAANAALATAFAPISQVELLATHMFPSYPPIAKPWQREPSVSASYLPMVVSFFFTASGGICSLLRRTVAAQLLRTLPRAHLTRTASL